MANAGMEAEARHRQRNSSERRQQGGGAVLSSLLGGALSGAAMGAAAGAAMGAATVSAEQRPHPGENSSTTSAQQRASGAPTSFEDLLGHFREMLAAPGRRSSPAQAQQAQVAAAAAGAQAQAAFESMLEGLEQLMRSSGGGGANVAPVASSRAIAALPEREFKHGDAIMGAVEDESGAVTCTICLGDFEEGDTLKTLPCAHSCFHAQCIDAWLARGAGACPICRREIQ